MSQNKFLKSYQKALKVAHRQQDLAGYFQNLADDFQVEILGSQHTDPPPSFTDPPPKKEVF